MWLKVRRNTKAMRMYLNKPKAAGENSASLRLPFSFSQNYSLSWNRFFNSFSFYSASSFLLYSRFLLHFSAVLRDALSCPDRKCPKERVQLRISQKIGHVIGRHICVPDVMNRQDLTGTVQLFLEGRLLF